MRQEQFRIVHNPLRNRPYGTYYVYKGKKYIGSQISPPSQSDCEFMAHPPKVSEHKPYVFRIAPRRGRPTNEEIARRRIAEKFEEDAWA